MNKIHKIEAIILKSLPFQDHHLILTLFSYEEGLLQMIAKGFANPKKSSLALTAPLTRGEFVYVAARGELQKCKEISLLETHLRLRDNLQSLEAGGQMIKSLIMSQLPGKSAPDLYRLLVKYLEKIPDAKDPSLLATSFLLKILLHDGLINCEMNEQPPFTQEEWTLCRKLALTRSFVDLFSCILAPPLREKIHNFFRSFFLPSVRY